MCYHLSRLHLQVLGASKLSGIVAHYLSGLRCHDEVTNETVRITTGDPEDAAMILGVSDRTFHRYRDRHEESGMTGLSDKRLTHASFRRAPVDGASGHLARIRVDSPKNYPITE